MTTKAAGVHAHSRGLLMACTMHLETFYNHCCVPLCCCCVEGLGVLGVSGSGISLSSFCLTCCHANSSESVSTSR